MPTKAIAGIQPMSDVEALKAVNRVLREAKKDNSAFFLNLFLSKTLGGSEKVKELNQGLEQVEKKPSGDLAPCNPELVAACTKVLSAIGKEKPRADIEAFLNKAVGLTDAQRLMLYFDERKSSAK